MAIVKMNGPSITLYILSLGWASSLTTINLMRSLSYQIPSNANERPRLTIFCFINSVGVADALT